MKFDIKNIIFENKNIEFLSEIKYLNFVITPNLYNNLNIIEKRTKFYYNFNLFFRKFC